MKKLIGILIVLLVAATAQADPNDGWAVWGGTSDGADSVIASYLGVVRNYAAGKVEFGAVMKWETREPWNEDVDLAGAYMMFHIPILLEAKSPNPAWDPWISYLSARPLVGIEGLIPTRGRDRGVDVNWLIGTLISLDPEFKTSLAILFATGQNTGNANDDVLVICGRIKF